MKVQRTYLYLAENKEVPDRDTDVPPVRKYANYRTLLDHNLFEAFFIPTTNTPSHSNYHIDLSNILRLNIVGAHI